MNYRTEQSSRGENLSRADNSLSLNFSNQDDVSNPAMTCPLASHGAKKRHYHTGLRMRVQQYNIAGRKMALSLPIRPLESLKDSSGEVKELFHNLQGSELQLSGCRDDPPVPGKLYTEGSDVEAPAAFTGDLICATELIAEDGLDGYQKGGVQSDLNEFLGRDIALHLSRTKTFRVNCTGDYDHRQLIRVGPLAKTEMMCCRVFTYLKSKINGADSYHEIRDGVIGAALAYDQYRKRTLIEDDVHYDAEGLAMPFIPGVYQFHVLMESSAEGSFSLKEIYCDGDCIYKA